MDNIQRYVEGLLHLGKRLCIEVMDIFKINDDDDEKLEDDDILHPHLFNLLLFDVSQCVKIT